MRSHVLSEMLLRATLAARQASGRDLIWSRHLARCLLLAPPADSCTPLSSSKLREALGGQSNASSIHTQSWPAQPDAAHLWLRPRLQLHEMGSARYLSGDALTTLQHRTSISATARALLVDTLDMVRTSTSGLRNALAAWQCGTLMPKAQCRR